MRHLAAPRAAAATGRAPGTAAAALVAAALLGACAADAWKPNPRFSAFQNQVERVCGTTRLGELTISQLMDPGSAQFSAYLLDMISRFEQGKVTGQEFAEGIGSTFNTVRDSAGIRCIVAQKSP